MIGLVTEELVFESCPTGSALFSKDRKWRYKLTRRWAPRGFTVAFGMLNPSTAGAEDNDPTITRCVGFARRLGASGLTVINLGARIATDPKELLSAADPVGPANVAVLEDVIGSTREVVVAWGAFPRKLNGRFEKSLQLFSEVGRFKCLGKTKEGDPRHPLYLPANAELISWP